MNKFEELKELISKDRENKDLQVIGAKALFDQLSIPGSLFAYIEKIDNCIDRLTLESVMLGWYHSDFIYDGALFGFWQTKEDNILTYLPPEIVIFSDLAEHTERIILNAVEYLSHKNAEFDEEDKKLRELINIIKVKSDK